MSINGPIIFVDDDADDQFIYEEICRKLGVANKLRFFERADTVLKYLRETQERPFIIFCDINMPEMDGITLRKQINDEDYLRRKSIPFVFFSTAATPAQVRVAYDLTVQGFFLKEQNFADSYTTIKMILEYWRKCYHPNNSEKYK
jgi:CheY-like chemotaxis protein